MAMNGVERRLSAILSADVVGYSRLMAEDETSTVLRLNAYREEIALLVRQHDGRVVDFTGDNFLAEFRSALNAVRCALEIKGVLEARNACVAADRRLEFRTGVHLGDVRVEGERIFGVGVNVASRLEGLADPGGICVSGAVHEQVAARLDLDSTDLGMQSVKNIPDPVRVYRVRAARPSPLLRSTGLDLASIPSPARPSIVVLPFVNMSADAEQEYFCDGMAEEVINALVQVEGLHVVARTSAFSFKHQEIDVREIGARLGVQSVLEGSVRRAGESLRIAAQLVDVETGFHLWSDRFDRRLDDVFAIQDEISARIVETLKVKLDLGAPPSALERTGDQRAYDLYLRGKHHRWLQTREGFEQALACFEQARVLDPGFAGAHAGVGLVHNLLAIYGFAPRERARREGELAALRAVELAPRLGEAHAALGFLRGWLLWDWESARSELMRAIELAPGDASARLHYTTSYLLPTGRTAEAVAVIQRAHELDPLLLAINLHVGLALYFDRQYSAAIRQFRQTLSMFPEYARLREHLVAAFSSNGMPEDALEERVQLLRSSGREKDAAAAENAFAAGGEPGLHRWELERMLPAAEEERRRGADASRSVWNTALLCARLGETDEAFRWLEEAVRLRDGWVIYAKVHPWLDALRGDPRFDEVTRNMGLG